MKRFTIYGRGGHLGNVTQISRTNFRPPTHGCCKCYLALIGQAVKEKTTFENKEHIYVCSPGAGAKNSRMHP